MKPNPKYPCRNCVYFVACGQVGRTEPCAGRMTKTEKKKEVRNGKTEKSS